MHPMLHMSTLAPYGCMRINSGARYHLVTTCFVSCRDKLLGRDMLVKWLSSSNTSCAIADVGSPVPTWIVSTAKSSLRNRDAVEGDTLSFWTILASPKSQIFNVQSSLTRILQFTRGNVRQLCSGLNNTHQTKETHLLEMEVYVRTKRKKSIMAQSELLQ